MTSIRDLWSSGTEKQWMSALDRYHDYITRSEIAALDAKIDPLDREEVGRWDAQQWFDFLYNKYFAWKYTAPNRLATTRASLAKHKNKPGGMDDLFRIKECLLNLNLDDIERCLSLAKEIGGLGVAGASGLLSLLYPDEYGTVDEFLILAVSEVGELPEIDKLQEMACRIEASKKSKSSFSISVSAGVMLEHILRKKAHKNNEAFGSSFWTPRKVDKVLWAAGHL